MATLGTVNNPISLEEDQDTQQSEHQLKIEAARNKSLIEEALLSSQPEDLCFAVIKTTIKGDLQTKQREINKAIIKYFKDTIKINISCQHFHPRIDADYSEDTTLNPRELLLYGVDLLTTKSIKDRFTIQQTNIQEIVWINNSTCKLIFGSAEETKRVMEDQTKQVKIQEDDCPLPKGILQNKVGWFTVKSYTVYSFQRPLEMRYVTSKEVDLEKIKISQEFAQARKTLARHLLTTFNATDKYRKIVQEIQTQKLLERRRHRTSDHTDLSRSRDKFKSNQRNRREYEGQGRLWGDQRNNRNNRYAHQATDFRQTHEARYANRPVDMNTSYNYNRPANRRNEGQQHFERDLHQFDTSFHFTQTNRRNNNNNQSFQQNKNTQARRQRHLYDVADIDSQLSFNNFGSEEINNPNEQDDSRLDYRFQKQECPSHGNNPQQSYVYRQGAGRRRDYEIDQSFVGNARRQPKNTANLSFLAKQPDQEGSLDLSFNIQLKQKPKPQQDFFEFLNSAQSVVSSIHEPNQIQINENSFIIEKKSPNVHKKNKADKLFSQSFDHQDSY